MSEPTGPAGTSRPPVVPIILGLLLVVVVVAAGLLVERATDSDLDLPDELAGGFRVDDKRNEVVAAGADHLEDVLDAPVVVRAYVGSKDREVTLTVIDAAAGPYAPFGPYAPPESIGLERGSWELVREADSVCQASWPSAIPEGQEVPDDDPVYVKCQLGSDDRTYWLDGQGLSVDDAVEILEEVAD